MGGDSAELGELLAAMKRTAEVLRHADVRFGLAGGLAVYARGGTYSDHDVRAETKESPYARAFLMLVEELNLMSRASG